jgi:3-oxoacyl-[acyl-carrier protein] reductase
LSGTGVFLSLENRAALVTGGSGGVGRAVVQRLLAAGAQVASVDLPDRPAMDGALQVVCDVGAPSSVDALFEELRGKLGSLDVVVHCAGITRDAVIWKMEDEAWSEVLRVNLDSAFHLLKRSIPWMREREGGSVVLISSINGERGKFGQANYAASKAGLIGLGRTAAREAGRFGIRVNVIAPGWIDTEMTASLPGELREQALQASALGRNGKPEDVADAALFLASPMSRHVTGQVLRVDGGQWMS